MKLIHTVAELREIVNSKTKDGISIGFVPTMGALHLGHISLVEKCVAQNDLCIVSVFVNPTQFNNKEDLDKYPRTLECDALLLEKAGAHILFAPSVDEIYPETDTRQFDFGQLDKVMEGKHRPGHFNGVAQVVSRLFEIVKPHKAYFGEKDFQQLAIIKAMVEQLKLDVEIVPMPIVRESNGLAMSSRNQRLSPEQKDAATVISKTLFEAKRLKGEKTVAELKDWAMRMINEKDELETEYFEIVGADNLQPISQWGQTTVPLICTAAYCGDVRLIDNIKLY